jgi:hypothetical protein
MDPIEPTSEQLASGRAYIDAQIAQLSPFIANQIPTDKIDDFVAGIAAAILNPVPPQTS